jgi:ribA/ribD-fused uncharacterized protein
MQTTLHEYRDTVMFYKPEDLYGEFSNWFPSRFQLDAETIYTSGEQMIMHSKAIMFGDLQTAQAIMNTEDPVLQQQQGRTVKGFQEQIWQIHRTNVLLD